MLESLVNFFKRMGKKEDEELLPSSSDAAKERLHLVLMQDRVNVSVDFLDMMKQEILDVIKKYIDVDEKEIDVKLTNQINEDGSNGSPVLYANIPIVGIKAEKSIELNQKNIKDNSSIISSDEKVKISNKENSKKSSEDKSSKIDESTNNTTRAKKTTKSISTNIENIEGSTNVTKVRAKKVDKSNSEEEKDSKKVASTTTKKRATTKKETVSE